MQVKAWIEQVVIPTYKAGKPEKNPMFLEKRVYQGSSGVVYPHAVIEKIADEREDQQYTAVYLENEYLKIMVLPELGGRIQRAYDKVRNRDFVYYNRVIKPALVGLAGPWISGGIEFNWPQHHRPSTFSPVDFTIEEHADGSKTVWVNEWEQMFRTKGMAGFTLYPGKAYLEIKGRLFNRSPFAQTFLWWANPAVKVNEHYQSIFPPDVYAVFDHGKRDVSDFPIATGTYYKVNYAPGTDISRYHTIPVPTSYMAIQSKYDFMGCYEHDTQAGMLHVADHHLSPGKKQWTWGNGDFGYAWDRNLTDEDGPYIELMTGVFTDNQPDFSWLQPNEVKSFEQYFMPYALIGSVKNATKDAMLNLEAVDKSVTLKVYTTSKVENARVRLYHNEKLVEEYTADISPETVFLATYLHDTEVVLSEWKLSVHDGSGNTLVSWQEEPVEQKDMPSPAKAAGLPAEIETIEELYLTGLHLEQYRHATFDPVDYYEEALQRSPGDVRCNNALGLLLLRRGRFAKAEGYFRRAIDTLTKRNPNPYDGEPFYNLGWALVLQGKEKEAYAFFYKATWNDAWQHNGFLALARLAASEKKWELALQHVQKSLVRNHHSHTARHLHGVLLRLLGRNQEALASIQESLALDPFNFGCHLEAYRIRNASDESAAIAALEKMKVLMRDNVNNYLELSLDYAHAGLHEEAIFLLQLLADSHPQSSPLVYYYLGWYAGLSGNTVQQKQYYQLAAAQNPDRCFPNKVEEIRILQAALQQNPSDYIAAYALGNLWYDKRQHAEAIACWQQCIAANEHFPTAYRNLSLAYYNKLCKKEQALLYLEKAFALDPTDARVLMELDQLYKLTRHGFSERLSLLETYPDQVMERDDLYLEKVTLYNNLGVFDVAREMLASRQFHPWEGGEGRVVAQFLLCHTALAKEAILAGAYEEAIVWLNATRQYAENLGEGKLYGAQENDIHFLLGCAYEGLRDAEKAQAYFTAATKGISAPVQALYYNDPQPDKIVYQGLAWKKLGKPEVAADIFNRLIDFGRLHYDDEVRIDYFAVSLPDMLVFEVDLQERNQIHCLYLQALGYLGLGEENTGIALLHQVLHRDGNHQGAVVHLKMLPFFSLAKYQLV